MRAHEALGLSCDGVESAPESHVRLLLHDQGLPPPRVNAWITDEAGVTFARVDLLYEDERVVIEYEGDHHRTDARQFRKDITRTRRLEALGYRVIRVSAEDLATEQARRALVILVRAALGR